VSSPRVEALLDAAEAEFAEAGFDTGSLRKIMRYAGTDPGAVHYHFGSREALADAVLTRILEPLNTRRLELLDAELAGGEPSLPSLIEALVRPDIETAHALHARAPGRARLISAMYLRPAEFVEATVAAHFAPVADAFLPHLQRALPDIPSYLIAWRVRWCIFGTVGALLADASAPFEHHPEDLLAELVRMFSAALAA
jgi:AcrR family transcriptional regulator